MIAVILGAGEGTRMRPLTHNRPKVMLPVLGTPILGHIVNTCAQANIKRVIIVTGYHEETIHSHLDDRQFGVKIEYVTQEKQNGTADAIGQVKDLVDERFLALNGDSLIGSITLKRLVDSPRDRTVVIAAKRVKEPAKYGVIEAKDDAVLGISEKPDSPASDLANIGIYAFEPIIFDAISRITKSARGEYEITDAIQLLINMGHDVRYIEVEDLWIDVGMPWDLLRANELLLDKLENANDGIVEPFATLKGPVNLGRGSIVRNGAYIVGPVKIGENCEIGPNCFIRPRTCLGDRVKIGNAVEVKNSVIMDDTRIGHLSYVGDSVIGQRCNFGAGTLVANLRFDEKPIEVSAISTGRRKLGAIMGDDVRTGINSMINVGTSIGCGSIVGVGALAAGVYPPGSRIEAKLSSDHKA